MTKPIMQQSLEAFYDIGHYIYKIIRAVVLTVLYNFIFFLLVVGFSILTFCNCDKEKT